MNLKYSQKYSEEKSGENNKIIRKELKCPICKRKFQAEYTRWKYPRCDYCGYKPC